MRLLAPSVADEEVQAAEAAHGALDELFAERLVAQVAWDSDSVPAVRLHKGDDLARVFLFGQQVVDRDICTLVPMASSQG